MNLFLLPYFTFSCDLNLNADTEPVIFTLNLKLGKCISIYIKNNSYFHMFSSNDTVTVERFFVSEKPLRFDLDYKATIPDTSTADDVLVAPAQYTFTTTRPVRFSIVYGIISNFNCQKVIIDNNNPWDIKITKDQNISQRICYYVSVPSRQKIVGELQNCKLCPQIDIYDGSSTNLLSRLLKPGNISVQSNRRRPLIIIVSPNNNIPESLDDSPGFNLSLHVTADPTHHYTPHHLEYSFKNLTVVSPIIHKQHESQIYIAIGIGIMMLVSIILIGKIAYHECLCRAAEEDQIADSLLYSIPNYTQTTNPAQN